MDSSIGLESSKGSPAKIERDKRQASFQKRMSERLNLQIKTEALSESEDEGGLFAETPQSDAPFTPTEEFDLETPGTPLHSPFGFRRGKSKSKLADGESESSSPTFRSPSSYMKGFKSRFSKKSKGQSPDYSELDEETQIGNWTQDMTQADLGTEESPKPKRPPSSNLEWGVTKVANGLDGVTAYVSAKCGEFKKYMTTYNVRKVNTDELKPPSPITKNLVQESKERITKRRMREYLQIQRSLYSNLSTLPFTLILWVDFILVAMIHGKIEEGYQTSESIRSVIGAVSSTREGTGIMNGTVRITNLTNIETADDIWGWVHDGFVPKFVNENDLPILRGRINLFNKAIGAARLQQTRALRKQCSGNPSLENFFMNRIETNKLIEEEELVEEKFRVII